MTDTTDDAPLGSGLEQTIAAVPGVAQVYRAVPAVEAVVASAAETARTGTLALGPRVHVTDGVVHATIATRHEVAAPQVAHDVHDAVEAFMQLHGQPFERVELRIARID